jgi:hypothetical protein
MRIWSSRALATRARNALTDADGRTAEQIAAAQAAAQPDPDVAQRQQDALAEEQAAREANPLNLAPAGTPQAGSPNAEGQRLNPDGTAPQADGAKAEQARNDAEQGKPPAASAPGDANAPPPPPPNPAP